ncbi:MAG: pYEATS domain-containing protein [Acidobacteriota bacterium]
MRKSFTLILSVSLLMIGSALAGAPTPSPSPIQAGNTSKYSSGHYNWTIYLIADDATLRNVDHVVYTLHPSFPNPVQTVNTRGGICAFALASNSWGEFNVGVRVVFKDGRESKLNYWLSLLNNKNESGCDLKSRVQIRRR